MTAMRALLATGLLLWAGCVQPGTEPGTTPGGKVPASSPLAVAFEVLGKDLLFDKGATLRLTVSAWDRLGQPVRVESGIALQDSGLEVVRGDPPYAGTLGPGESVVQEIMVKAAGAGPFHVRGWAEAFDHGGRITPATNLVLRKEGDGVAVETVAQPQYAFQVRAERDEDDPRSVRVTLLSPVTVAARVTVVPPTGLAASPGNWEEDLSANEPAIRWVKLEGENPPNGRYDLYVNMYPHASLAGGIVHASLAYEFRDGRVVESSSAS